MENSSKQLCASIDIDSFFAKKAVVSYSDKKIEIELSKQTLVVHLVDIVSMKMINVPFFGGRIICIKTTTGDVVALRVSDYSSLERFIRTEFPSLVIQRANNPFWITSLYFGWIVFVISYAPIMSYFSSSYSEVSSGFLAYGSMYVLSVPILLLLSIVVVRVVPVALWKKWLLCLWLIPVFGFGVIVLNLMNKYLSFVDMERHRS